MKTRSLLYTSLRAKNMRFCLGERFRIRSIATAPTTNVRLVSREAYCQPLASFRITMPGGLRKWIADTF